MGGKGSGGNGANQPRKSWPKATAASAPLNLREPKALPGEPQMPSGMTEEIIRELRDQIDNLLKRKQEKASAP